MTMNHPVLAREERFALARDESSIEAARAPRRPYAAPRIESGEAFERVQLASDCNSVLPGECDPVC